MAGMNVEEKEDMCRFVLDINDEFGTPSCSSSTIWGGHGSIRPGGGAGLRPPTGGRPA